MRLAFWPLIVAIAVGGCGSPSGTPARVTGDIRVRTAAEQFCPLMHIPYPRLTMRINPAVSEQIEAIADDGVTFDVWWPEGFHAGASGGTVILDQEDRIAASDRDVIEVPARGQGWPQLHGYRVCAASGAIYVVTDPV